MSPGEGSATVNLPAAPRIAWRASGWREILEPPGGCWLSALAPWQGLPFQQGVWLCTGPKHCLAWARRRHPGWRESSGALQEEAAPSPVPASDGAGTSSRTALLPQTASSQQGSAAHFNMRVARGLHPAPCRLS